jgi:hypothetical protein
MIDILTLIVMSLPIVALLGIAGAGYFFARTAARRAQSPRQKWIVGMLVAIAVVAVAMWDEIAGRSYYYYLCSKEGGPRVYRHVTLPDDYWNADGSPAFIHQRGYIDHPRLDGKYAIRYESNEKYSALLNIRKDVSKFVDKGTGEVLGTYTVFLFFGGWLQGLSLNKVGISCPADPQRGRNFLLSIFVPERGVSKRGK